MFSQRFSQLWIYLGDEEPLHGSPELCVEQPVDERGPDPVTSGQQRDGELHSRRCLMGNLYNL